MWGSMLQNRLQGGVQAKTVILAYGWQIKNLQEYLVSGGAEAMYKLVLMMAKSLHHVCTVNLTKHSLGSDLMLNGCQDMPTPCQVLHAGLAMSMRVLM